MLDDLDSEGGEGGSCEMLVFGCLGGEVGGEVEEVLGEDAVGGGEGGVGAGF